ncbi:Fusaric acid resistance protein-like [Phanerochaete sordida]|uniref:Fusaric acid resistance protein-like n=1 Tax=Phanerochaete sordida TaxID=48140 RepID=A0A9P3GP91_9APHY|nr:Fusaric acid resistance protein-like [Phanerochaete sordida]
MTPNSPTLLQKADDALRRCVLVFASKRALARLLSTFLCCVVVVILPFSRLGGSYAFLVLALKELVFSVQESLAQQLELTILNILGALLGIAISTLGKFIAAQYPVDSATSRATCATFLVLISFFAGLVKSRLPRLNLSMRIGCFASIWILTDSIGVRSYALSGNFLWITLSAAIICLVSLLVVMSLLHWSVTNFERDIASTFIIIQDTLRMGLALAFPHPDDPPVDPEQYQKLKVELLSRSIKLNENYSQAAFELRIGRLSLRSMRPLIGTVEHLRRELAWGMPLRKRTLPTRHHHSHFVPRSGAGAGAEDYFSSPPVTPTITPNGTIRGGHGHTFFKSPPGTPLPSPPLPFQLECPVAVSLEQPAQALGSALLDALSAVERTILLAFHQSDPPARLFSWREREPPVTIVGKEESTSNVSDDSATPSGAWTFCQTVLLSKAESDLLAARDHAREELKKVFRDLHTERGKPHLSKEALTSCLAMIALLQMAQELLVALQVAQRFATYYENARPRLWYPRVSLAWLGVPPGPYISDDPNAQNALLTAGDGSVTPTADNTYTAPEWKQGLREHAYGVDVRHSAMKTARMRVARRGSEDREPAPAWNLSQWIHYVWSSTKSLRFRIRLWRVLKATQRSSHLRHALKNACGVALLSLPAFLPASTGGPKWFLAVHGQWMVISYLWVLETNIGATWRIGYLRILGTCIGAIYAYIAWLIAHRNPYGLVTLVTVADLPITWLITQTNLGPLAVPCSVAIPPIAFAKYISPHSDTSVIKLALLRAGMISLGMVAALLMNSFVFPRHSRVYFLSDTSRTLGLLTDLYLSLSHDMFHDKHVFTRDERRKTLKLELEIRNALHRLAAHITTMHNELDLLPKPLRHYRRVVTVLQNVLDLMTGLRKIRENIPRKVTVAEVFHERREFMSCVCIALFACQHAFRAREPLPQFLPSARHAFEMLEDHVQERINQAREEDPEALGLSLVYAFAEQQVMRNMVDTLEALLELTGSLFGTSTWLTAQSTHMSRVSTRHEEGDHGWYSTFRYEEV